MQASGSFDVTMSPEAPTHSGDGVTLGRVVINKVFRGDLAASGRADMVSALTSVKGSAGYVAIERVVGTLHGRAGSFVLQHSGTMTRGQASLTVSVVPDSGTGALEGIAGQMTIDIVDGKHLYTFDYTPGQVA